MRVLHRLLVIGCLSLVTSWCPPCHALDSAERLKQQHEKRASDLFAKAQRHALRGAVGDAVEKYDLLVKNYPRSPLAGLAQWEIARLFDENQEPESAFDSSQLLIDHFPPFFEKALAMQYKMARKCLAKYDHLLRTPDALKPKDLPRKEQVSEMLRIIIQNAPYHEGVADAQYLLGVALEKEGAPDKAREQHETFAEKFPKHELADDACYQIAYIDWKAWQKMKGQAPQARDRAETNLLWFLARYPGSDKAAQAAAMLYEIIDAQRRELQSLAEYYEKLGKPRAAAIYYRVLVQKYPEMVGQPGLAKKLAGMRQAYPDVFAMRAEPVIEPVEAYDPVRNPILLPPSSNP